MTRWYPLETADGSLFDSAPHVYRYEIRCAAPPQTVWDSLASDASLSAWGPETKAVHWTGERPFGVGTEREVVLAGGIAKVHERFFRWDEGAGYSFCVYEASVPLFRRFAEDYVLEPDGTGTLLRWTIAIEPKARFALPVRVLSPVNGVAFGRVAASAKRYFAH